MSRALILCAAFLLDAAIGDPEGIWHPVRAIGKFVSRLEDRVRHFCGGNEGALKIGGAVIVALTCAACGLIPWLILKALGFISVWLRIAAELVLCWYMIAAGSLKKESMRVYEELDRRSIGGARYALSRIVGRDTDSLDEEGIIKAAVETVAENTTDGVVAPMLAYAIGGITGMFIYKAVNTMDSMLGYMDEHYRSIGCAAARTDDLFNYIPSRVTAHIMIMCCPLAGLDRKNAARVFKRDKNNHKSPNAGQTEAVMAGALGIQLGGSAYYFGKLYEKKTFGDPLRSAVPGDIERANKLMYIAAIFSLALCMIIAVIL